MNAHWPMFVARVSPIDILPAMGTPRVNFRRRTVPVFVLEATLGLAFIATGIGCIPGSVSGEFADGSTTTVTTALACSQTPSGCLCASRDEQPGDLSTCSGSSVAVHGGEQGVCCGNADLCTCDAYACKSDAALAFCQCGPTGAFGAALQGAASASCPAPDTGQKCCQSADTHVCICSTADCEMGTTVVPNCTVAVAGVCDGQRQSASSCK
jgi:hypothetical protein